jgi:hypothetical protein
MRLAKTIKKQYPNLPISMMRVFRQESNFYYLTGCDIPATQLICWCTRNKQAKEPDDDFDITSVLLIPEVDNDDVM